TCTCLNASACAKDLPAVHHPPEELEVLPRVPHPVAAPEEESGVVRRDEGDVPVVVHPPPEPSDALLGGGQLLRREGADREDRPGRDELELTVKEAGTGLDLVGPGVPVPRRPALEDVADEDLAPREPDREEEQVQELSGRPDERPPGP